MHGHRDHPLSAAQERIWVALQLAPGSHAYTISLAWRLTGPLRPVDLGSALQYVIDRHEALRATFPVDATGRAHQRISTALEIDLPLLDLTGVSGAEQVKMVREIIADRQREPMNVEIGPLLRAAVMKLSSQDHVLCMEVHHLIFDGWSVKILSRELGAAYTALTTGRPLLAPPAVPYTDVMPDRTGEPESLEYWCDVLAGMPATELPPDHDRPATAAFDGASVVATMGPDVCAAVRELCRRGRVSPYMVMLAAYLAMISLLLDQTDVAVATPVSGRTDPVSLETIGMFTTTLVVRVDVLPGESFLQLLGRVRERVLLAHEHQSVPFSDLLAELGLSRRRSGAPVTPLSFDLDLDSDIGDTVNRWSDVDVTTFRSDEVTSARFDLELFVGFGETQLRVVLSYATELFDRATVEAIADCYTQVVRRLLAEPGQCVDAVELLTGT